MKGDRAIYTRKISRGLWFTAYSCLAFVSVVIAIAELRELSRELGKSLPFSSPGLLSFAIFLATSRLLILALCRFLLRSASFKKMHPSISPNQIK